MRSGEPDWVAESAEPEPAAATADPLDWISGEGPGDQAGGENWTGSLTSDLAAASASSSTPDAEDGDLPEGMRDLGPAPAAMETASPAEPTPAASPSTEMDWLEGDSALPTGNRQAPTEAEAPA